MKRKTRLTMYEAILYRLIKNYEAGNAFIDVFALQGDVKCPELGIGGFISHEVSARCSELNKLNPGLLQIEKRKSLYTPSTYYAYRLSPTFTPTLIRQSSDLENFARRIFSGTRPPKRDYVYDEETGRMTEIIK